MNFIAGSPAPVTHPTTSACGGWYCTFNYDTLLSSAIALVITLVVGLVVASRLRNRGPGKLQMIFELFLSYVRGLVKDNVAEDAAFIVPIAATIGFYILIANWLAFFPLPEPIRPPSSDFNQTFAMGIVVVLVVQWYAIKLHGFGGYLHHFTRPFELPKAARVGFVFLNVIEELVKPVTLALRLFGNLFAGILMVWLISQLGVFIGAPLVAGWKAFDVFFIGTLQAFIFMLLTVIYFGMVREGMEEHDEPAATAAA